METTEQSRLDRRGALKALFGFAVAAAAGGALLMPSQAEAAPLPAPEGIAPDVTEAAQDVAADAELPAAEQTQYYYYRRPRRRVVYVRPRRVYYVRRRPARVVYVRRRRRYW